ncbi:DNA binding domain-containing protein, excisionase family [Methylobacterium sp. 174MFSha1.1]|uniref:helix-turn-helix domain-containing protein n=1 Tax=Methylobacterium sp. 174MFSha1.1 TaxID=1502749 RepID=UPI0008F39E33|nr:helix-turn-helix domain-containing protein [Methylobacterium sp. 174MFSha1.1]SFV14520.1 DNA binding domain-containing protein, excisionase family [Methylobacterium sp. 174MFSha1.1]
MDQDMREVLTRAWVDIPCTARFLGIGKNAAYRAVKAGEIPSVKIGGLIRVPTAPLREMAGLPAHEAAPKAAA